MNVFLTVQDGKIQVWDGIEHLEIESESVETIVNWLKRNNVTTWMNSSTMDFSDENDWPTPSARNDIHEYLEKEENLC